MASSARQDRLNAAVLSRAAGFGEPMTFTRAGASTGVPVTAAITRNSASIWSGGMIGVVEDHHKGYIIASSLTSPPVNGDTLTTSSGSVYEIDQHITESFGLWMLVLRKLR